VMRIRLWYSEPPTIIAAAGPSAEQGRHSSDDDHVDLRDGKQWGLRALRSEDASNHQFGATFERAT
jgi:hypothetical protein